jgi:sugar/nucleoside kinase (ribokinase family)
MSVEVLCVGHACWDLCFIVDGFPAENAKIETELLLESGGGPAANAAWLLARWGIPTTLAAVVGDDEYGRRAGAELREGGVDCRFLEQRSGHVTPVSAILSNRLNGSRTICNRKRPTASLTLDKAGMTALQPSLLLFDGHELDASLEAMRVFPKAITVLDAGSLRKGTETLSRRVDYLVCSERFASQVTGEREIISNWRGCLEQLRALNGKAAAVTLGAHGVAFDDGHACDHLPALSVRALDTTAAGDIFHGAFAYGLVKQMKLREALRLATVAAGLSVEKMGGRLSVPDLETVNKTLRQ